jgi:uncharacterized protein YbjT (DUF2867 family)
MVAATAVVPIREVAVMAATAADARVALLAGATGLVGREVLAALLADKRYAAVHVVGRRKLSYEHGKLTQQVVNFSAMGKLPQVDEVFIALGTTIKTAGSKQAFRAVDYEAVMAVALAARASGATKLGVISAMGADASSSIFYNRVKGEMEAGLETTGYQSLVIARPSMLAGNREALDQPVRSGERIALVATRWLKNVIPANYQSIAARDVACALVNAVADSPPGVHRMLSGEMQGAADRR